MDKDWIIYDGECGFCNKFMIYFAKKDLNNNFIFVSNKSIEGISFLTNNNLKETSNSSLIVKNENKVYIEGMALRKIFEKINVNQSIRIIIQYTNLKVLNFTYKIIAKNRLILTKNNCEIPASEIKSKFITS
jgi:predicted DCC family thiol-disulfide oxidoreductase YuxK